MRSEILVVLDMVLLASALKTESPQCHVETNGCSTPKGVPRPFVETFTPACNRHDVCYRCGYHYRWSRKQCDKAFKSDMKKACRNQSGWLKRHKCRFTAGLFYMAVRTFGKSHYRIPSSSWCQKRCTESYGSPN
ncbi:unnamed protein product [Porites evermanni]|uniref:Conodipine-M alpha chain n=1 Tax=Porites evermanni TaxID=104178 RepID=A0ABN8NB16_9CNID|nr:unnamed protein product [Porites evermanni]